VDVVEFKGSRTEGRDGDLDQMELKTIGIEDDLIWA
jgi:hypothetical protein